MRQRGLKRRILQLLSSLPAGQFTEHDLLPAVREAVPLADASGIRSTLYKLAAEGQVRREGAQFATIELSASADGADAVEEVLAALAKAERVIRALQVKAARWDAFVAEARK